MYKSSKIWTTKGTRDVENVARVIIKRHPAAFSINTKNGGTGQITKGELSVFKQGETVFKCDTIEPAKISSIAQESCAIPFGVYKLERHQSPTYGQCMRVSNKYVPADRQILIHAGNYADETKGCILPGKFLSGRMNSQSKTTLTSLMEHIADIEELVITPLYEV